MAYNGKKVFMAAKPDPKIPAMIIIERWQALDAGWEVEKGKNHRWGTLHCGHGCKVGVWSTPRRPETMAKRIREEVRKCPHDPGAPTT